MNVVYDPKKEMSFKTELFDKWLHVGAKQYTISARKVFFFFKTKATTLKKWITIAT